MAIFGKFAYADGMEPATLLLLRFALSAATLWLLVLGQRTRSPRVRAEGRTRRNILLTAVGLGALGYSTQAGFYFGALDRMDASVLAIVFYTFPVFVTLGAVALGRDRLTVGRAVALAVAVAGTGLVVLGGAGLSFPLAGTLMAFGAAVTYTAYILVADSIVDRIQPLFLSAMVMTGAAVTTGLRTVLTGGVSLDFAPSAWLWLGCLVLISTVLAMGLFFAGLHRTGPSSAAILSTFEPVVTAALAALLLAETLSGLQLLGGLLVLVAVVVLQMRGGERPGRGGATDEGGQHEPVEHLEDVPAVR